MIGALLFLNTRGDIVLSRAFRDAMSVRALADTFKYNLVTTKRTERCPINIIDRVAYLHLHLESGGLFLVACCNTNANAMAVYQYMIRLVQILTNFFSGEAVTEESLKEHFVLVQEVIDETIDYGYPQITETNVLRSYLKTGGADGEGGSGGRGGIKQEVMSRARAAGLVTNKAAGPMPWRKEGLVYRDNEAFMDIIEEINLLMSSDGEVLQRDVTGVVKFKSFLSGMPRCQLVMNDVAELHGRDGDDFGALMGLGGGETIGEEGGGGGVDAVATNAAASVLAAAAGATAAVASNMEVRANKGVSKDVALDDVTFHPCVKLGAFGADRTISFVPPDGEFDLMTYRVSGGSSGPSVITPPISVIFPRVEEVSKTRMTIDFRLKSDFPKGITAKDIVIKIPCPSNTANVSVRVKEGKAKFAPTEQAIVWKIKSLEAFEEIPFSVEISLIAATLSSTQAERAWARPPITVRFTAPSYAASGMRANQLHIKEPKLGYSARKWVRYQTNAGEYECRLGEVRRAGAGGGGGGGLEALEVPSAE